MNDAYIDTIEKLQRQGLEALKQAQAAQTAAVSSIRELVTNATGTLPGTDALRNIPAVVSKINELNTSYAMKLIEQQNAYVSELVNVLKSASTTAPAAESTADKA
jgi:hypothetical protein